MKFMDVKEFPSEYVKEWVGVKLMDDTKGIVAVDNNGKIAAIVLLMSWTETSVMLHWRIDNPFVIRAGLLKELYYYIFEFGGRELIIGTVPSNNEKALRLNKKLGMRETYRIPEAFEPGVDYVIMEITKDEASKWSYQEAA